MEPAEVIECHEAIILVQGVDGKIRSLTITIFTPCPRGANIWGNRESQFDTKTNGYQTGHIPRCDNRKHAKLRSENCLIYFTSQPQDFVDKLMNYSIAVAFINHSLQICVSHVLLVTSSVKVLIL